MWNIEWTLCFTMEIVALEDPIILWTFEWDTNCYFQCQMTATQLTIEVTFVFFMLILYLFILLCCSFV